MKKAMIASLLLAVLAANMSAQLTFSGDVYIGIQFDIPYGTHTWETASINAEHPKEGSPRLNLVGTAMRENFGARFDATFQHTTSPADRFSLNGVYGWATFLDNSLRFTMGQISSAVWVSSLDRDHEFYFDAVRGFRIEYNTPIQGLSVGTAFRTNEHSFETFFKQMIFGASFIHPQFNTVIAYDLGGNANLLFGFNYTGIPDLEAGIQIMANHLASWDSAVVGGILQFNQRVGYRLRPFGVAHPLDISLVAGQTFFGAEGRDIDLVFTPSVSYRILPNLTGIFSTEFFFTPADFETTRVITLNPRLEYMLRGPAFLYFGYELRLARYKVDSHHRISFGIEIRAF